LHHDDFWQVSLREFDLITSARCKGKDREFRARRVLNQEMGILTQFAFHDPKKMPDFTRQTEPVKPSATSRSQDLEKLRAGLLGLHYHSKRNAK